MAQPIPPNGYTAHPNGYPTHPNPSSLTAAKPASPPFQPSPNDHNHEHDHDPDPAQRASRFGHGPFSHMRSNPSAAHPAFGGEPQPGLYKAVQGRQFANPAPLGLSAFALTTFVLSLINMGAQDITRPNIVVALAFAYGGLVQLLAGMWEMAVGNTFGATALSSYGGFWISFAIILTPGFRIVETLESDGGGVEAFHDSFAIFLFGWFIFTFILLLCTLKSTVAFFSLFFTLTLGFLFLALAFLHDDAENKPHAGLTVAGGVFGLLAGFLAWYNALAGIADTSNSFFIIPVGHFPWSEKGREARGTSAAEKNHHTA